MRAIEQCIPVEYKLLDRKFLPTWSFIFGQLCVFNLWCYATSEQWAHEGSEKEEKEGLREKRG